MDYGHVAPRKLEVSYKIHCQHEIKLLLASNTSFMQNLMLLLYVSQECNINMDIYSYYVVFANSFDGRKIEQDVQDLNSLAPKFIASATEGESSYTLQSGASYVCGNGIVLYYRMEVFMFQPYDAQIIRATGKQTSASDRFFVVDLHPRKRMEAL